MSTLMNSEERENEKIYLSGCFKVPVRFVRAKTLLPTMCVRLCPLLRLARGGKQQKGGVVKGSACYNAVDVCEGGKKQAPWGGRGEKENIAECMQISMCTKPL